MSEGQIEGSLGQAHAMGRYVCAGTVKKSHELGKPVTLFSHQIFLWNADIGKKDIGGIGCAKAHFSV